MKSILCEYLIKYMNIQLTIGRKAGKRIALNN